MSTTKVAVGFGWEAGSRWKRVQGQVKERRGRKALKLLHVPRWHN